MSAPSAAAPRFRLRTRILALGLATLCALVLAEIGLTLYAPDETAFLTSGFYDPDPELGLRLQPGASVGIFQINALGMRGKEVPLARTPGTRRILLLGDSFTFGALDDPGQSFASRLGTRLQSVEVLNSGTPTWGTRQQLRYLERDGLELQPDLVLLCMYLGNDITDNIGPPLYTAMDGYIVPASIRGSVSSLRLRAMAWLHQSHLYRFLRYRLRAQRSARAFENLFGAEVLRQETDLRELRIDQHRKSPEQAAAIEQGWKHTFAALQGLKELTRQRGVEFAVVLIPDDLQINPHWHRTLEKDGVPLEQFDFRAMNRRLAGFFAEQGIAFLDLSGALAPRYQRKKRPYGPPETKMDGHFNELGDAVAAREILYFLQARGWPLLPL